MLSQYTSHRAWHWKNVIVNCQSCFQPGQLDVAFGRFVSVAGLKIINLSCCRNKNEIDNRIQENSDTDTGSEIENTDNSAHDVKFIDEDSDFSDSEINKLGKHCWQFRLQSVSVAITYYCFGKCFFGIYGYPISKTNNWL